MRKEDDLLRQKDKLLHQDVDSLPKHTSENYLQYLTLEKEEIVAENSVRNTFFSTLGGAFFTDFSRDVERGK